MLITIHTHLQLHTYTIKCAHSDRTSARVIIHAHMYTIHVHTHIVSIIIDIIDYVNGIGNCSREP